MSTDLFDDTNPSPVIDPNKDYSADLIGEGKKFKDTAALARGKVESDFFIQKLQSELSELRQELNKADQLQKMIDKLNAAKPAESVVQPSAVEPGQPKPVEDLDALFEKKFAEREAIRRRTENVNKVGRELHNALGPNYTEVLKEKAAELGVTKEWINNLAAESPQALLRLVGAEGKTITGGPDLFTPPQSSTHFKPVDNTRNKSFYDKIKAEDPARYRSKEVQVAMHRDAIKLGEAFFV